MQPFREKPRIEPNVIEKMMKKIPQKNFLVDLNNYLANSNFDQLSHDQVIEFEKKYGVKDSVHKYNTEMIEIFRDFLNFNLGNESMPNNDRSSANIFQNFLGFSDEGFKQIYMPIAKEKFKIKIQKIIQETLNVGREEEKLIEEYRTLFGIDEEIRDEIKFEVTNSLVKDYYDKMIADERVSPDEIAYAEQLAKNLNVSVNMSEESKSTLERFKKLWIIENGDLPIITPEIMLPKNEVCYLKSSVNLYENRKVTKRVGYAGPTARVKIMKGVYFRAGNVGVTRQTEDTLTNIDSGNLYITNKKILFKGNIVNKTYRYNQIIDIIPYSDGLELVKDTGKSPTFISLDESGEIIASTIARVMKDNYL